MALCNVFTVRSKGSEVIIVFVEVSDTKIMLKGYSRAGHVLASSYDYSVLLLSVPHADIHTCTAALALVHAQTHVRTDTHTHTHVACIILDPADLMSCTIVVVKSGTL